MRMELTDIATDNPIHADVCIIGAGAAGITLARSLARSPLQVCLLEAGGFDHEDTVTDLGVGENIGQPYYDLADSRLRFFGGTTNIWGGRCVPLDPEDLVAKPWVPNSGWPITYEDLRDGYRRAHQDLELGPEVTAGDAWRRLGTDFPPYLHHAFTASFWYFDELAERFSAARCRDLLDAANVRVITHASVTHLQANPHATGLTHVAVRSPAGKTATVSARVFVLAAGAVENARLMLMSRDVETAGIGNGHDQVGRYFMEHPHGRLGRVESPWAFELWRAFKKRFPRGHVPMAPVLRLGPEVQAREGALNTALTFKLQRDPALGVPLTRQAYQSLKHQLSPTRSNRTLWHAYKSLRKVFQRHREPLLRLVAGRGSRGVYAMIRGEQPPNPDSRVILSERQDAFGNPRADLDWRSSHQEKHTLQVLARNLATALEANGLGTFRPEPWIQDPDPAWPVDPTVGNHPIGGYHHMGTTRMAATPRQGVTDANCRVYGYYNLFVAGSSVFTTSGWANPTLTILALAHRLATHLEVAVPKLKHP